MYSAAFTRSEYPQLGVGGGGGGAISSPIFFLKMGPLRVILRHFKTIQCYIYKVIFNVKFLRKNIQSSMICMQLKMFKVLQSIIILSMIYARTTTFSIKFILGKMKFPVCSLIFFTDFQFPCVFPDIKSNFQIP